MAITLANSIVNQSFLGKGLKSPLTVDPATKDFSKVQGSENIKQCVLDLIMTSVGERVMNEDIGASVNEMLFMDVVAVADILPVRIIETINRYEPRVTDVVATAEITGETQVDVHVSWKLKSTGSKDSLVYPFYVEPAQGGIE